MANIEALRVEVDGGDNSILVARNIEDIKIANSIHAIEGLLEASKVRELTSFKRFAPRLQRTLRVYVAHSEVLQCLVRDHTHNAIYLILRYIASCY